MPYNKTRQEGREGKYSLQTMAVYARDGPTLFRRVQLFLLLGIIRFQYSTVRSIWFYLFRVLPNNS